MKQSVEVCISLYVATDQDTYLATCVVAMASSKYKCTYYSYVHKLLISSLAVVIAMHVCR